MSFVILSLPRSRTAWLSRFLSYGDWACGHDELRHCRSLDDVKSWFSQENTGTCETAAAPFWRLIPEGVKVVVIRRPVDDVVQSLARFGVDPAVSVPLMRRLDAKLGQIEKRVPGVLSVQFAELEREDVCARVFEHCLPYRHDPAWWGKLAPLNLQINMRAMARYGMAYAKQTENVRQAARQKMLSDMHRNEGFVPDSLTISEEPFESYFPGALDKIREHAVEINEGADYPDQMNFEFMKQHADAGLLQTVIARSNGRVFGYLLTVLQPCFLDKSMRAAHHTSVWASSDARGVSQRMYRVANGLLREKGVSEIIYRAGVRGDGPRLGTLFRRLGAEPFGQLYRQEVV